jgi:hypothetical protein
MSEAISGTFVCAMHPHIAVLMQATCYCNDVAAKGT